MPLQATSGAASYDAFGGGAAAVPQYIEDVFSTYLYTGNSSTQTITNNIDLSTKGGMVWIKCRNTAYGHRVNDTVRGASKFLNTASTAAQDTNASVLTAFTSSGFSVGASTAVNENAATYASWAFREQPKFFDVVTYTGNGSGSDQTINHNLGSTPGCIIVKATNASQDWLVWHRATSNPNDKLFLNKTDAVLSGYGNGVQSVTSTSFRAAGNGTENYDININGRTYVAYLFAHDAGGFGLTGTDNVISCGSFTSDGSSPISVNLGYEPQWVLVKASTASGYDWWLFDNMRGTPVGSGPQMLRANASSAENTSSSSAFQPNATGFTADGSWLGASTFIYIAIRRGPMKVPTSGTSVFDVDLAGNSSAPSFTSAFPVDLGFIARRSGGDSWYWVDRLRGGFSLTSDTTAAEASFTTLGKFDYMNGYGSSTTLTNYTGWNFRRAPSFMDVVCYTGNDVLRTINHNLGVAPEMMIIKCRDTALDWAVYHTGIGNTKYIFLNSTAASVTASSYWNNTSPTASVFTINTTNKVNSSPSPYVAYLFATCAGISKVGSYTGNGSTQTIDCGFGAGGARFVLIKRTDSTSGWYVYDTSRGMTTLTDPYMFLNNQDAEAATLGSVTTVSTGFALNSTILAAINVSAATYIFLAIA